MIKFEKLRFKNFLSTGNNFTEIDFLHSPTTLVVGHNGAGKSTLSNILTGLYRQDDGIVEVGGTKVEFNSPRDALNAGIGMVHQHFRLVSTFTVAENVVLGESDSSLFMDQKAVAARVKELSDRYALAVDPSARIWQLSVGEQQRVARGDAGIRTAGRTHMKRA